MTADSFIRKKNVLQIQDLPATLLQHKCAVNRKGKISAHSGN